MTVRFITCDVLEGLAQLPDGSVHCVVTSPPYYGLRDYDVAGQIGLEATPDLFIGRMVEVFREVRRVLRDDGSLWLNLGDGYVSQSGPGWQGKNGQRADRRFTLVRDTASMRDVCRTVPPGLKPKDMMGMPWRVAFALQADGWWLRSDVIWHKPNPMPESVTDRPTKAHEYVFMLTRSERYFYDAEAVREVASENTHSRGSKLVTPKSASEDSNIRAKASFHASTGAVLAYRNKRTVWTIPAAPFPEAHFATFPADLPEECIKAGTSEHGCCAECGAPWEREVSRPPELGAWNDHENDLVEGSGARTGARRKAQYLETLKTPRETLGWFPSCACNASIVPCTVFDPFSGAGTTAMVADRLGRDAIGIELNADYVAMAEKRLARDRLERGKGTMADVEAAKLEPTPLEALMQGDGS